MSLAYNEPRFDIEASNFRCKPCGAEVPCEGAYYSAILLEEGAFRRSNYCASCWSSGPPTGEVFAFWRTRRPPLPTDKPRRVRFDPAVIFEFFRRLEPAPPAVEGEESAPLLLADPAERDELRFVLALLLVRKKALDFKSSVMKDGAEWLQLELRGVPGAQPQPQADAPSPPKTHWVRNPQLTDAELERVKLRIGELLQLEM